jgi:hypothetical protein
MAKIEEKKRCIIDHKIVYKDQHNILEDKTPIQNTNL